VPAPILASEKYRLIGRSLPAPASGDVYFGLRMAKPLTIVIIRQTKANGRRREIPDGGCPGLYLVVQESEHKAFAHRYRSPVIRDKRGHRKPQKLTLGPLALDGEGNEAEPKVGTPLTLADARRLVLEQQRLIRRGIDPAEVLKASKLHSPNLSNTPVDDVFAEFLAKHIRRKRKGTSIRESTRRKAGRLLGLAPKDATLSAWEPIKPKAGVLTWWKGRAVGSITKADVRSVIDAIAIRAPVHANRTLSAIKQAFGWAVSNDIIAVSPAAWVDAPSPEHGRERDLSGNEIVAIWRAAGRMGYPYGHAMRVLLLTGQRVDEVVSAIWAELDLAARTWTLPPNRTKNGRRARKQFPVRGDKAVRAQSIRGRVALNGLYVPVNAPWYPAFRAELLSFPAGRNDDQVDALGLCGQLLDVMIHGQAKKTEEPAFDPMKDVYQQSSVKLL
jgi:hypothetical protein